MSPRNAASPRAKTRPLLAVSQSPFPLLVAAIVTMFETSLLQDFPDVVPDFLPDVVPDVVVDVVQVLGSLASPKAKTFPFPSASQYPLPLAVAAMPTTGARSLPHGLTLAAQDPKLTAFPKAKTDPPAPTSQ